MVVGEQPVNAVLHYVDRWLEVSAGFVHAHVSRSRHRGVVVARLPPENLDAFAFEPLYSLAVVERLAPERWDAQARAAAVGAVALARRAAIIHVHFGYAVNDVVGVARRLRIPLVVSLHGHDATAFAAEFPHHYDAARAQAAAVVVPSQRFAGVVEQLGFPAERIHVIPAGVDTEWFAPAPPLPTQPVVAFVGRLVEKKGLDVLAAAWPAVAAAVPGAQLRIVGDGPLADRLPVGVHHELPLPTRLRLQVRDTLRAARVVVTPSRTAASGDLESLLLVNLEAQATGRPVVTTDHGGIPEFVQAEQTALVVPENDPPALAAALVRVLSDDRLAVSMAAAGPPWAAQFDVGLQVQRLDALYDDVACRQGMRFRLTK